MKANNQSVRLRNFTASILAVIALSLSGCSGGTGSNPQSSATASSSASADDSATSGQGSNAENKEVVVIAHDSFSLPKEAIADFEKESGYKVTLLAKGDAGSMVNQLVLTASNPIGDVAFGVDNSLAGLALNKDVFQNAKVDSLPADITKLSPDPEKLVAIDQGDVCINYDIAYFEEHKLTPPATFDDLVKPEYKDLWVTSNPAKSTPGLMVMLATVAQYGQDGWLDFWEKAKANGVKVVDDWSTAYYNEFTLGEEKTGKYPIVTSYSSSPSYGIDESTGKPTSASIPGTCARQIEYAGVLKGAKNQPGATAFINWLLSEKTQILIPENLYMYPVIPQAMVAADNLKWDKLTDGKLNVDPKLVSENRQQWVQEFTEKVIG